MTILIFFIVSLWTKDVVGSDFYTELGSSTTLVCPFKADSLQDIIWNGPPNSEVLSIGSGINPSLPIQHKSRLSITGNPTIGEYNLRITNIQQSDEGGYKCSGISGGSSIFGDIKLLIQEPPSSSPVIFIDPTGDIIAGSTVKLICTIRGGKPLAAISWECPGSSQAENGSDLSAAISTIHFVVNKNDNGKTCQCIGSHSQWTRQRTANITMDIKYAPSNSLSITQIPDGGILIDNQKEVKLTCTVTGGYPIAILHWNCDGTKTNESTENTASYIVTFVLNKTYNNRICTCSATHIVPSYRPSIGHTLIVFFKPENDPIIIQNPPGYIIAGTSTRLTCEVSGGNPLAILSWNCTGTSTNNTSVNRASYSVQLDIDRNLNNIICACSATHVDMSYRPSVRHVLLVAYIPDNNPVVKQVPEGGVIAGEKVTLLCTVSGGNPLATLTWDCQGNKINDTFGTTASYSVEIIADKSYNNRTCTCSAAHFISSYKPQTQHKLIVFHVPDGNLTVKQTPKDSIIIHHTVTLMCSIAGGNPLAKLSWNCTGTFTNSTISNLSSYSVEFNVEQNENNRVCTCTATHIIPSYRKQVHHQLVVFYGPVNVPSIRQNPNGGIINGNSVTLTCEVSGGNPLVTLMWNCSGSTLNNTTGDKASYSVVISVDKKDNKKICACSTMHPDPSYQHTIQHELDVLYAPDKNPVIQQTPSGSIIAGIEIVLTCTVSGGNPLATLTWNCTGVSINSTAGHTSSYSVTFTVDKTFNNQICTCSAIHPIFSYKPLLQRTLIVYFKPFLDTTSFNSPEEIATSENDSLFITVSIKSNPRPIIKWTFKAQDNIDGCNNSSINSTNKNDGLHSSSNISIDRLKKNQFGHYTLMATNIVGIFRRKFSVLENGKPMSPSYVYVVCKSTTAIVIFKPILNGNLQHELYIQYTVDGQDMTSIKVHMNDTNQAIEYTVTGLNPGRKYNFYILAVNLFGQTRSNQVKCLTDTLLNGEDMQAFNKDNSGMLSVGIASLVVGLLLFVAATLFIFRKRFKKTYTRASKSEEYSDLQTSNPAFQDPYTSIQNPIESRHHQELIANTYEECGNASEGAAYQNMENMKSGHKNAEKNIGIYDNMKI